MALAQRLYCRITFISYTLFLCSSGLYSRHRSDKAGSGSNVKDANETRSTTDLDVTASGANVIEYPTPHPAGTESGMRKDWQGVSEMRTSVAD